jgi:SAM-dependent methyltransferase
MYDDYHPQEDLQHYVSHFLPKDFPHWAKATRKRLRHWLPSDLNTPILDLGCGSGRFLLFLQQLGYTDLTGVDWDPEKIPLARRLCPGARIFEGDLREFLAKNPDRYGLITALDVLEHFGKREIPPLLGLIKEALVPGGRVIIQTPNAASPLVGDVAYGDFTHEWFFTPASLSQVLSSAGLVQFEARPCGPYIHGLKSLVRALLWQMVSLSFTLLHLIECGGARTPINTRVFLGTAVKEH